MSELYDIIVLGFVDPMTLSFLVGSSAKLIGSAMGPDEDDTQAALDAAVNVSHAQKKQVGNENKIAQQKQKFQKESLLKGATKGGQKSLMNLTKDIGNQFSMSGFESNEEVSAVADNTRAEVYTNYGDSVDKIVEEAKFAKLSTDLNVKNKIENIEKEMDSAMSAILSTPDTFIERFTGTSNNKVGN